ncbi:iron-containing alcohol dehydrogenase [Compostimonas suwonensis]|uniref:Alcohol dehydrogenase n=1 Tax=Compostimonas suwonensis TaxID=1048394 RepID=A0A2M9BB91_9MICO|nr:iron-containing alcohol dehydrogenase [Compostimonas suwonensis]PJJ55208.1 alcohol dehydrogenase [Compostimonas suwonensis]
MSESTGVLRLPEAVQFGRGARAGIPVAVARFGRRAFVVVDPFLAGTAPFAETLSGLDAAGVTAFVYTGVVPELPLDGIDAAVAVARGFGPDVVLGYGGGSALDLAKLVSLLLVHPGPLSRYYGENAVPSPILPVVAVPTTAGTGSEVTPVAVVSDPERELKVGVSDAALVPRVAIVDPELTVGAPPTVTAASGIDALVHAVESFTAAERAPEWGSTLPIFVGRNRLSSVLALDAVRALGSWLPRAVADGSDVEAREQCAYGSLLAGMAFGSGGTHLSHALQYPIGAITHTPHGVGTGMMLPYVLQALRVASEPQLAQIGEALGVRADAQAAIDRIALIVATIGIPRTLADIGITRDQLPRIAELARGVTRLAGNAALPPTRELLLSILEAAYTGDRSSLS